MCIARCCSQTGMTNPLFHQIPRYTIFLKDGHPSVTKGMESSWLQTELIRRYDGELCASGASGQSPDF